MYQEFELPLYSHNGERMNGYLEKLCPAAFLASQYKWDRSPGGGLPQGDLEQR